MPSTIAVQGAPIDEMLSVMASLVSDGDGDIRKVVHACIKLFCFL